jgi:hypothetical protein
MQSQNPSSQFTSLGYDGPNGNSAGPRRSECQERPATVSWASTALVRFLAEQMKLPLYAIMLKRGEKSRDKVIQKRGLSEEDVRNRLSERD